MRELKKRRTRRLIADAAMRLFLRDGFENVGVRQIAAAAEVSLKTVYNYFPSKADLVFDESDEILTELLRAIRERPSGQSALAAVARFLEEFQKCVPARRPPGPSVAFRRLIEESPTLRAHRRAMFARMEAALAVLLAEQTGAAPSAVEPFIAAAAIVAVFRARFEVPTDADQPEMVQAELRRRNRRALALLQQGLDQFAVRSAS